MKKILLPAACFLCALFCFSCSVKTAIVDFDQRLWGSWERNKTEGKAAAEPEQISFNNRNGEHAFTLQKGKGNRVRGRYFLYQTNPRSFASDPFASYKTFSLIIQLSKDQNERRYGISFSKNGELLLFQENDAHHPDIYCFHRLSDQPEAH